MIEVVPALAPSDPNQWLASGDVRAMMRTPFAVYLWDHPRLWLRVLSSVEPIKDGREGVMPQYHISISKLGDAPGHVVACSAAEALWVVEHFGMEGGEEDNHVPNGVVRNWWRPVADRLVGKECECFALENIEVVGDFVRRPLR